RRVNSICRDNVTRKRRSRDNRLAIGAESAGRVPARATSGRWIVDDRVRKQCAEIALLLSRGGNSRRYGYRYSPLLSLNGCEEKELVLLDGTAHSTSKRVLLARSFHAGETVVAVQSALLEVLITT